jgi:hypothetical protein
MGPDRAARVMMIIVIAAAEPANNIARLEGNVLPRLAAVAAAGRRVIALRTMAAFDRIIEAVQSKNLTTITIMMSRPERDHLLISVQKEKTVTLQWYYVS